MKKTGQRILYAGPSGDGPLFKALHFVLQEDIEIVTCQPGTAPADRGILAASNSQEFSQCLASLLGCGCKHIAVLVAPKKELVPANVPIRGSLVEALEKVCRFGADGEMELKDLCEWLATDKFADHPTSRDKVLQFTQATNLFHHIASFSHGGQHDITNAFLAPVRMLARGWDSSHTDVAKPLTDLILRRKSVPAFTKFDEAVRAIPTSQHLMGALGADVRNYWNFLEKLCSSGSHELEHDKLSSTTSSMMMLLTEIRERAGIVPSGTSLAGPRLEMIVGAPTTDGSKQPPYRVLVVDDNGNDWKPVFEILANRLAAKLNTVVHIEFSTDGTEVDVDGKAVDVWSLLPDYDVVLLDLYLPTSQPNVQEPQGIKILSRIRERLMRLPVIVWTSSMQANLPAKANQANGFLFKKDAALNDVQETITQWLPAGKGVRGFSLLNPFFDHVIRTPARRERALAFTYWALKTMDGLHGLDQCYFRYFNDHGGRHLNGVLCNLEKLIRPLLLAEGANATFAERQGDHDFEREMFWLYVATLCHDTGMFPLPCEDEVTIAHRPDLLKTARKRHGLRVLALLNCPMLDDKTAHYDLGKIRGMLDPTDKRAISLIAAYHSQSNRPVLPLGLLDKPSTVAAPREDVKSLPPAPKGSTTTHCHCCMLEQGDSEEATDSLKTLVSQYAGEVTPHTRRIGRLCALLRLADGIDIDYTRLPAAHLLQDLGRSIRDDCENFKRQVLENVEIDRGVISLIFRIPSPDGADFDSLLATLSESAKHRRPDKIKAAILLAIDAARRVNSSSNTGNCIDLPQGAFAEIADGCDAMLDAYFRSPVRHSEPAKHRVISIAAVLAVWCEVNERYKGIEETSLDEIIKLGEVTFTPILSDRLTILSQPSPYESKAPFVCPGAATAVDKL